MGNEQSRMMRQQFEQSSYFQIKPNFQIPFEHLKVVDIDGQTCLVQELNTEDYKQTFVQVDKFLKKMNKRCPQIASFLFISENRDLEHIFFLVFEFGTQVVTDAEFGPNFTRIISAMLKALAFMEDIQLFYPKLTLSNVIRTGSDRSSFKLINQFCFKETFRFVVEYLLNVQVSEQKQLQLLNRMKNRSLCDLIDLLNQYQRDFPTLCEPVGPLSNIQTFLSFVKSHLSHPFSFASISEKFESLFDISSNRNKKSSQVSLGGQPQSAPLTSTPTTPAQTPKKMNVSAESDSMQQLSILVSGKKPKSIKLQNNRPNSRPEIRTISTPKNNHLKVFSSQTNRDNSKLDLKQFTSVPGAPAESVPGRANHKRTGSRKYVIHHKKGSSGFYSINDNRLDRLTAGARFSEISAREEPGRTTIQRQFPQTSNDLPSGPRNITFKKKKGAELNLFTGENEAGDQKAPLKKKQTVTSSRSIESNNVIKFDKNAAQSPVRNSGRQSRYTTRSTLMSHVQDEYNFHDNPASPREPQPPGASGQASKNERHFSFSKDYTIAIDPKQKEQIQKYITRSSDKEKLLRKSAEKKSAEPLRIARMSENIFGSSSKDLTNDLAPKKSLSKFSSGARRNSGLKRSSSSSFIKKEHEELKKKQMKRSIYNLQRREKNDGVKKYCSSRSNQLRLKTQKQRILSRPENRDAPRYLDFGDCPGYSYRVTLFKSDNNALADKRFFNNPRNFYVPEMLIDLNSCHQKIRTNISSQLIEGLKTAQMNDAIRLRRASKYIDFENLVNFDCDLRSSVYHDLDALEQDFDLEPPKPKKQPSQVFFFDQNQVEQIDNETFKMQGIEFKVLDPQKTMKMNGLKPATHPKVEKKYPSQQRTPKVTRRVPKNNVVPSAKVQRVPIQRQMKSSDPRIKYRTGDGPNSHSMRKPVHPKTFSNFYPPPKMSYSTYNPKPATNYSQQNYGGNLGASALKNSRPGTVRGFYTESPYNTRANVGGVHRSVNKGEEGGSSLTRDLKFNSLKKMYNSNYSNSKYSKFRMNSGERVNYISNRSDVKVIQSRSNHVPTERRNKSSIITRREIKNNSSNLANYSNYFHKRKIY